MFLCHPENNLFCYKFRFNLFRIKIQSTTNCWFRHHKSKTMLHSLPELGPCTLYQKTFPYLTFCLVSNFYFIYSKLNLMAQQTVGFDITKVKQCFTLCRNWGHGLYTKNLSLLDNAFSHKFLFHLFEIKIDGTTNRWFRHHKSK